MSEEQKSNFDHENLNESSNESPESSKGFRMPWNKKFGEDENLNNRQYSRAARNQPEREATTLSKVLLFMVICVCVIPFVLFFWVNASRQQTVPPRTASQVSISRAESSSASSSSESSSSSMASASSIESSQSESSAAVVSQPAEQPAQPVQPQQPQQQQPQQQQPAQQGGTTYVVQAGDSWYGIATRNGVDLYALLAANGATVDTTILPGQTIIIP